MICSNCNREHNSDVCPYCGTPANMSQQPPQGAYYQPQGMPQMQSVMQETQQTSGKPRSAYIAGLLHLFIPLLGLGYFYRGMNDKGKNCIIMFIVGICTSWIFGIGAILLLIVEIINMVEAVKLFSGSTKFDAYGRPLMAEF